MRFDILTLFPNILKAYCNESILKRAQEKGVIKIVSHQLRDYTTDKHHKTDEIPYGGGAGMVLKAEPILRGVEKLTKMIKMASAQGGSLPTGRQALSGGKRRKIIILSAKGKPFTQKKAYDLAKKYDHLILVSGRYEGIDERVKTVLKAEEISIGPYVTTDGDVGAMIIVSAVTRLLPGVIRWESLQEESHWNETLRQERRAKVSPAQAYGLQLKAYSSLEYPHYTRPEVVTWKGKKYRVPKVLLSGNHKEIEKWRSAKRHTS